MTSLLLLTFLGQERRVRLYTVQYFKLGHFRGLPITLEETTSIDRSGIEIPLELI